MKITRRQLRQIIRESIFSSYSPCDVYTKYLVLTSCAKEESDCDGNIHEKDADAYIKTYANPGPDDDEECDAALNRELEYWKIQKGRRKVKKALEKATISRDPITVTDAKGKTIDDFKSWATKLSLAESQLIRPIEEQTMKITRRQLRQMIKESGSLNEEQEATDPDIKAPTTEDMSKIKNDLKDVGITEPEITALLKDIVTDPYGSAEKLQQKIVALGEDALEGVNKRVDWLNKYVFTPAAMTLNNPTPFMNETNTMKNENIRAAIQELIKEINEENRVEISKTPSEPKQLSEARTHVRKVINEMMVGLTPITRMNTQRHADNANKGNNTNPAIDKAELGFNTFDMQEWASIAGITENTGLSEHWADDGYGSNVIDLLDADSDEIAEVPEMWTTDRPGLDSGDLGHDDVVGDTELGFEKFMRGMGDHEHDCGCNRCEEERGVSHADEDEFNYTAGVGEPRG